MKKHPATYTDKFLPLFADLLLGTASVLDPMAGSGKLARIKAYGYSGRVICNELERGWANGYAVDEWYFGDAAAMWWAPDASFDAIATSPTYGNRMADHHHARDASRRITYRHRLGRALHTENTGAMQWGAAYRKKHTAIYRECLRVLQPGGLFVLNVSDHIRAGRRIYVSRWHLDTLRALGLSLRRCYPIKTPRNRFGANAHARCKVEYVFLLQKTTDEEVPMTRGSLEKRIERMESIANDQHVLSKKLWDLMMMCESDQDAPLTPVQCERIQEARTRLLQAIEGISHAPYTDDVLDEAAEILGEVEEPEVDEEALRWEWTHPSPDQVRDTASWNSE